jgi:hypothetical protein
LALQATAGEDFAGLFFRLLLARALSSLLDKE